MQKPHKRFFRFSLVVYILLLYTGYGFAQGEGVGGVNALFTQGGAGARALALGNAYVAVADDPSAVYWNSAGLDFIERTGATFYYTSLLEGGGQSFVGVAYPTMSLGGFGFGWLRFGGGEFEERDDDGLFTGTADHGHNLFLFSYAKQIRSTLSAGLSFKVETLGMGVSDSGFGLDFGLLYRPDFDNSALRDLSIGINLQNIVQPKLKLVNRTEASPRNFKIGLAKPFYFGDEQASAFSVFLDFNKSERSSGQFSLGAEYSFNNHAMLRAGTTNGQIAFGAGASYSNFRFDYSYGKLYDSGGYAANHRFSITFEIGKSKTERIELARRRAEREFQLSLNNQLWFENETEFNTAMEDGREKYYNDEYRSAYAAFRSAIEAASNLVEVALRLRGDDQTDTEANLRVESANGAVLESERMFKLAETRLDSAITAEIKAIASQQAESEAEAQLRESVLRRRQRGDALFMRGAYSQAISEWEFALNELEGSGNGKAPEWVSEVISGLQNSISAAQSELEGNVEEAIRRSDKLVRDKNYVEALNVLNELISIGLSEEDQQSVNARRNQIQAQLTFQQNFDQGMRSYEVKDWNNAAAAFERALRIKPTDAETKRYWEDAQARAQATKQDFPPDLRLKFSHGLELFGQGKFQEALAVWEEIRQEQPYNKTVLDAIDRARESLKKEEERRN